MLQEQIATQIALLAKRLSQHTQPRPLRPSIKNKEVPRDDPELEPTPQRPILGPRVKFVRLNSRLLLLPPPLSSSPNRISTVPPLSPFLGPKVGYRNPRSQVKKIDSLNDRTKLTFKQQRISIRDRFTINADYYPIKVIRKVIIQSTTTSLARSYFEPRYQSDDPS